MTFIARTRSHRTRSSRRSASTHSNADHGDLQIGHGSLRVPRVDQALDRVHQGLHGEGLGQVAGAAELVEALAGSTVVAPMTTSTGGEPAGCHVALRSRSQPVSPGRFRSRSTTAGRKPSVELGGRLFGGRGLGDVEARAAQLAADDAAEASSSSTMRTDRLGHARSDPSTEMSAPLSSDARWARHGRHARLRAPGPLGSNSAPKRRLPTTTRREPPAATIATAWRTSSSSACDCGFDHGLDGRPAAVMPRACAAPQEETRAPAAIAVLGLPKERSRLPDAVADARLGDDQVVAGCRRAPRIAAFCRSWLTCT